MRLWRGVVARLVALELGVQSVVRGRDVRERGQERDVVLVDAVAEGHVVALQHAGDHAERLVGDVVAGDVPLYAGLDTMKLIAD